jgi:hypothetical protein
MRDLSDKYRDATVLYRRGSRQGMPYGRRSPESWNRACPSTLVVTSLVARVRRTSQHLAASPPARSYCGQRARAGRQADRQADRQTGGQADRRTGRQADRQTGGQADRQTEAHSPRR